VKKYGQPLFISFCFLGYLRVLVFDWSMRIFLQFIVSLIGSILLGIAGLIFGATIGGNYGFPAFGGNVGYESGGVFFAIVGISLGAMLGAMFVRKLRQEKFSNGIASMIAIVSICVSVVLFDYKMPWFVGFIILLLPATAFILLSSRNKV